MTEVSERYSLLIEAQLALACQGANNVTRLVAKVERCVYNSRAQGFKTKSDCWRSDLSPPPHKFHAERALTVVCTERCVEPCQNGGTCNSTQCVCPESHMGARCQCARPDDPCQAPAAGSCTYCLNNGTCEYEGKPRRARCECEPRWTGAVCQYPVAGGGDTEERGLQPGTVGAIAVFVLIFVGLVAAYVISRKLKKYKLGLEGSHPSLVRKESSHTAVAANN